uniref:Target of myb1 like 1 membrane trafficking protein n=1 Tax=Ornithorhynchus anatinus TaxID=9258 RepID=A0A6I8NNG9_ORNAN
MKLLDLCVRNCGPSFRALVVKKDFAKDKLTELLNPRYNLPTDIQNQILTFVMTWSQGFEGTVDVTQVKELYLDLLKKGIRFPSSNTAAGTDAPERSVSGPSPIWPIFRDADPPPPPTSWRRPGQIGKLNSELDVVRMNVAVMLAILTENTPGSEDRDDLELLQKLYRTGRQMHGRITELLATVENEDVVAELIRVHENLSDAITQPVPFAPLITTTRPASPTPHAPPGTPSPFVADGPPARPAPRPSENHISTERPPPDELSFPLSPNEGGLGGETVPRHASVSRQPSAPSYELVSLRPDPPVPETARERTDGPPSQFPGRRE